MASTKLLKCQFLQNNLEKNYYSLARCFSRFYFGALKLDTFKLLIKILLAEIFEVANQFILSAESMDKLVALGLVERLKNSDFILETKIATRNQNKSSKQPDRPDAV